MWLPRETQFEAYLEELLRQPVRVSRVSPLAGGDLTGGLKAYGYGVPLLIEFTAAGEARRVVLETMSRGPFGHEHMADRAQVQLWAHSTFNDLPRHVRSLDVGAIRPPGAMVSLGEAEEFFTLTEFVEGRAYFEDLARIAATGEAPSH